MQHYSQKNEEKDASALFLGLILVMLVGGYFIGRFFWKSSASENTQEKEVATVEESHSNTVEKISAAVVRQKILNGEPVKFIDIRSQEAFNTEHLPNSISLTPAGLSSYTPAANEILVIIYSQADDQSYEVAKNIINERKLTAFFLDGGYEAWKGSGNQTISVGDPHSFVDQSKVVYISAADALKLINDPESHVFLLDVQSAANYARKHIKNAINIPLADLEKRSEEIPSHQTIIVYGENELTSFQAGVRLADLNIFTAKTLSGNKNLSSESSLPLEPAQ